MEEDKFEVGKDEEHEEGIRFILLKMTFVVSKRFSNFTPFFIQVKLFITK